MQHALHTKAWNKMSDLNFDRHQFERRTKVVSQESQISFQDYGGMHKIPGRRRHGQVPEHPWANDDIRLRTVLAHFLWRSLMFSDDAFPEGFVEHSFKEFCKWIDKRALNNFQHRAGHNRRWRKREPKNYLAAYRVARHGYSQAYLLAAYRVFRFDFQSNEAVAGLPFTPTGIRQFKKRIVDTARKLYPELCPEPRLYGGRRGNTKLKAQKRATGVDPAK